MSVFRICVVFFRPARSLAKKPVLAGGSCAATGSVAGGGDFSGLGVSAGAAGFAELGGVSTAAESCAVVGTGAGSAFFLKRSSKPIVQKIPRLNRSACGVLSLRTQRR